MPDASWLVRPHIISLDTECINGLHEGRIAGEGWEGVGRIGPQEGTQVILLGLESGELWPRHLSLHVTPDPLDRAQLGAVGRQEDQLDVLWPSELVGCMGSTVIQSEAIEARRQGLREGLDEALKHRRVQRRPLQTAPVTRGGLHGAIDSAPREHLLD